MSDIMTEDIHDLAVDVGKEEHDKLFPNCKCMEGKE